MEAARPRARRRRLGREDGSSALNGHLVRVGFLVVVPGLVALLLALSTPGTLPRPTLTPLFDGQAAGVLASTLELEYPVRVPGTPEALEAARWYRETIAGLGIPAEQDSWTEDVPGLGDVQLTNVVSVIPGRSADTIVIVAHRDNAGAAEAGGDNTSGTAALVELARSFAPQESGPSPVPQHTLVFLSTDGGAYGGAGAARFAAASPLAHAAVAAVILDRIDRRGRPELGIASDSVGAPPRALVGTAIARVREWVGEEPSLPDVATQLVDLGTPFGGAEQGRLLGRGIPAVTLTTGGQPATAAVPGTFPGTARLGQMGRASEALVDSLDASVAAGPHTRDRLFLPGRAVGGWAVRLTLVLLVVPIALGAFDLFARARRRRLPARPALRALRARLLLWTGGALLLGLGALVGVLPTGADLPLPAYTSVVSDPPVLSLVVLGAAFAALWLVSRRRLVVTRAITDDERLAGLLAAVSLLLALAIVLALLKPYALVFVLPALYAWPWIPLDGQRWRGAVLFVLGLVGPFAALALLAKEVGVSLAASPLYTASLVTVGYVSLWTLAALVVFAAAGAQFGALALGRYAPYADGLDPPPPGIVRTGVARTAAALRRQSSER